MKKLISVLLAGLLVAAMGGCSGTDGSTASAGEKLQVGIVQIMEHTSLDTIRESFLQQMEQLGYGEDKVDYDIQNAQGEQTNLGTICQKFVGDGGGHDCGDCDPDRADRGGQYQRNPHPLFGGDRPGRG